MDNWSQVGQNPAGYNETLTSRKPLERLKNHSESSYIVLGSLWLLRWEETEKRQSWKEAKLWEVTTEIQVRDDGIDLG